MNKEQFNEVLSKVLKDKGYPEMPYIKRDERGRATRICYVEFEKVSTYRGREYVHYKGIFGDLLMGPVSKYPNADVKNYKCEAENLYDELNNFMLWEIVQRGRLPYKSEDERKSEIYLNLIDSLEGKNLSDDVKAKIKGAIADSFEEGQNFLKDETMSVAGGLGYSPKVIIDYSKFFGENEVW